jgi:putative DNA-invertase from lambdoid prophage Rac
VALHVIDLGGDVTGNGISKMDFTSLAAFAEGGRDRIRDAKRPHTALAAENGLSGSILPRAVSRLLPNPSEQALLRA